MISIIIPTLNEEKYLPLLLESIKKQEFSDYEIILADAGSKDKTLEIAKKYNCRIIVGGLPAKGRNEGAKAARGDILFFIDADSILPHDFFDKSLKEFKERGLNFSSFGLMPTEGTKIHKFAFNMFYNWIKTAIKYVLCELHMIFIGPVRSDIFDYKFDHYKSETKK